MLLLAGNTKFNENKYEEGSENFLLDNCALTNINSNTQIISGMKMKTGTSTVQYRSAILTQSGNIFGMEYSLMTTNKARNKNIKSYNGNRSIRNIIKLAHWNMGNSKWKKRLEIEALTLEKSPDILIVS